jgi:hypothetical protein
VLRLEPGALFRSGLHRVAGCYLGGEGESTRDARSAKGAYIEAV